MQYPIQEASEEDFQFWLNIMVIKSFDLSGLFFVCM